MRACGEDPYAGQRLNYLAGTNVPFEPLLEELDSTQLERWKEFERTFPPKLASSGDFDRSRFFQEPDRFTMLLFLQADCYDVKKATQRLLKAVAWRQKSGFEDFVDNPDVDAWNLYWRLRPRRILGWGPTGRAISTEPLGEFFGSDNGYRGMSMKKWLLCYAFDISLQQAAFRIGSIRHNRAVHRVDYVGDLSGLRIRQCMQMLGFLHSLTKEVDMFFPECAGIVTLTNARPSFTVMINAGLRFLDPRTAARVSAVSGTPQKWLKDTLGEDALPVEMGGRLQYEVPHVVPLEEALAEVGLSAPLE